MSKDKIRSVSEERQIIQAIEEIEGSDRYLAGKLAVVVSAVAVAMSLYHLYTAGFGVLPAQGVIHLTFALMLAFLLYPYRRGTGQKTIPWYDWLCVAGALYAGVYMIADFKGMAVRAGDPNAADIVVGFIVLLLVLEATRRVLGLPLVILAGVFLLYGYVGIRTVPFAQYIIPLSFLHNGYYLTDLVTKLNSDNGIFGIPIYVSSTYVFIFVLFGAIFEATGAGKMFINFSLSLLGPMRGGPAKAAVFGSGCMGSISGSSVANVVTTGTFTIPLMKKVGFPAKTAGGIECAASTGGQLLPPVMGAAAFIMAETTGIPYWDIAKSALIPALLLYTAVFFMVHIEAVKQGIKGIPRKELPSLSRILMSRGILIVPIFALIYYLIEKYTPMKAAYIAIVFAVLISAFLYWMERGKGAGFLLSFLLVGAAFAVNQLGLFGLGRLPIVYAFAALISLALAIVGFALRRRLKEPDPIAFGWREIVGALELGARNGVGVAIACATAGILTGVVTMTGLGSNLSTMILNLSHAQIFLGINPIYPILVFAMIASIVLGMGLPTTATYIVLSAVMAPPLVEVGMSLMAAHLFVFYYGILADDTPPINLPAYAASGIAKSEPVQTGLQGFKYDAGALLLPFAFAMNPYLLLLDKGAPWYMTSWAIFTALIGIVAFTTVIQNYLLRKYRLYERILALASALLLLNQGIVTDVIGIVILFGLLALHWFSRREDASLRPSAAS